MTNTLLGWSLEQKERPCVPVMDVGSWFLVPTLIDQSLLVMKGSGVWNSDRSNEVKI